MAGWTKTEVISLASAVCAIAVFAFGILQYISSENWKRADFVAGQIKDFDSDKINQSVLIMMDYDPARVELFPDQPNAKDRYVDANIDVVTKSMNKAAPESTNNTEQFTDTDIQILKFFDHFFQSLARFNYFLESGAIKPIELCAEFEYPVGLMNAEPKYRDKKLKLHVDIVPFSNAVHGYLSNWNPYVEDFLQTIRAACEPAQNG